MNNPRWLRAADMSTNDLRYSDAAEPRHCCPTSPAARHVGSRSVERLADPHPSPRPRILDATLRTRGTGYRSAVHQRQWHRGTAVHFLPIRKLRTSALQLEGLRMM